MSGIYVTDTGFIKKTLVEIKAEYEAEFQAIFGNDIDLDASGTFGQLIGILSKFDAEKWDALEEIYTSRDPNQATGTSLDAIIAENGLQRLAATPTIVQNVLLEGTEGTIIVAGKKAKQINGTVDYSLDFDITITKIDAKKGIIEVTSVAAGTYRVTIDSINYDYVAIGTESKTDILDAIEALITAGSWTGTASVANEQLTLVDFITAFSFDITGNLSIEEIWSAGNFTADITGFNTLPANSLVEIVTPVAGWNNIINPSAGITGRDVETDIELRLRRAISIVTGNATDEAIKSNVFNDVDGVISVGVTSNRSDITDSESRPPHSFEVVVEGGLGEDIALVIWESMPAGIQTYGNTNETIQDSDGRNQIINFSRPEIVFIFIKVRRNFYDEEIYPSNGDQLIKEFIIEWSLNRANINIGVDLILQRLSIPIYEVPGIADIEITADSSTSLPHTPSYSFNNIVISGRQLATFAIDRIVVENLP